MFTEVADKITKLNKIKDTSVIDSKENPGGLLNLGVEE